MIYRIISYDRKAHFLENTFTLQTLNICRATDQTTRQNIQELNSKMMSTAYTSVLSHYNNFALFIIFQLYPLSSKIVEMLHIFNTKCCRFILLSKISCSLCEDLLTSELVLASTWEQELNEEQPVWETAKIGELLFKGRVKPGSAIGIPPRNWLICI